MHFADERISVCPHDTDTPKNQLAWYTFSAYVQRRLGVRLHFEPQRDFLVERRLVLEDRRYRLVYANPFSAALFRKRLGFIPVARPDGIYDESALVKRVGVELPESQPLRIASATDKLITHMLGLMLLRELGIAESRWEFVFVGTQAGAANAVLHGEADLGIVYEETWKGLAETTKKYIEAVKISDSKLAFHCFCISPEWEHRRLEVQTVLCEMNSDEKGKQILADLGFSRFIAVEPEAVDDLAEIIEMFV